MTVQFPASLWDALDSNCLGKEKSVTFGKAQCTRAWETQIKIDTSSVTKLFGYKFAWYKENH